MNLHELCEESYYSNDNGIVLLGDCLEGMKKMDDNIIDVSFTSPPYNDTGSKNEDVAHIKSSNTHKKYINVETRKDWFEWQCEVIDEMLRVTKKYVLYNVQGIKNNRKDLYKIIGRYADNIHDILIWYKPNGCPTSTPNKLSNKYEMVLILKPKGVKGVSVNSKYYTNVIVQNINSNKEYAKIHRAVMNKEFCDEIIKEFTEENDVVLDPFMGLGTTALSCMEQNRKFVGFELCDTYIEEMSKRLENFYK